MKFEFLADKFRELEETSSRLQMTDILSDLFSESGEGEISKIIYLIQGQVAPPFKEMDIGLGEKFVQRAIATATGYPLSKIEECFQKEGDLGSVAFDLVSERMQTTLTKKRMDVDEVHGGLLKIAEESGSGSETRKIRVLAKLLNNSSPEEAKYIVRIPLDKLRLGIGDPTIMDSLSVMSAGDKSLRSKLERGYNLCSDLGKVAEVFIKDGIEAVEKIEIELFHPIRPALPERVKSAEEIMDKQSSTAVEAKYDGFRLECHKKGDEVKMFSRRLDDMTRMFPEVVEAFKEIDADELIVDAEALSYDEEIEEFRPFQETMRRRRKYDIEKMSKKYPLTLFVFDLMYLDGEDYTNKKYRERRKKLEELFEDKGTLQRSEMKITSTAEEIDKLFNEYVSRGLEGIIAKDLEAPYEAGSRGFQWIKLKRSYKGELDDTIDLVIIGYYRGRGSRTQFGFGGILGAVYDEDEDKFKSVTRVGSGFTEEQMEKLGKLLKEKLIEKKHARVDSEIEPDHWVEPKHVVTVNADEITRSPKHTCGKDEEGVGYALRFPRMEGWIREDKKPEDATTVKEIIKIYSMQGKDDSSDPSNFKGEPLNQT